MMRSFSQKEIARIVRSRFGGTVNQGLRTRIRVLIAGCDLEECWSRLQALQSRVALSASGQAALEGVLADLAELQGEES